VGDRHRAGNEPAQKLVDNYNVRGKNQPKTREQQQSTPEVEATAETNTSTTTTTTTEVQRHPGSDKEPTTTSVVLSQFLSQV
jgi:hypothetical protein